MVAEAYIVLDTLGVVALDKDGNVLDKRLYSGSIEDIARKLNDIEAGRPVDEVLDLINSLKDRGIRSFYIEHRELARNILNVVKDVDVKSSTPLDVAKAYRDSFIDKYLGVVYGIGPEEYFRRVYEITVMQTRLKLRQSAERRDLFVAQAISAVDDIDKIANLVASRLREWYGIHFPELDDLTRDHREYATLVYKLGDRSKFTRENIMKALPDLGGERASRIAEAASKSVGASITDWDLDRIKALAKLYLDLQDIRRELTQYIDEAMSEVAPNIKELVGPLLGARLISLAGGLNKLALMPASTIQVLGAEKALFRALRGRGKPPKHGVIFQFPEIFRAPRWQRGKIARALAAKLAIAAKADAFTGNFIAPRLKEELMKRIQEVKTLYAKPPVRKPEAKQQAKPHGKPERERRRR